MKLLSPTATYQIFMPDDIQEDYEDSVASFWRPDSPVLLQLSTRRRTEGSQVRASQRLDDRIQSNQGEWSPIKVRTSFFEDVAAAKTVDQEGATWIHVYMTNGDLAVYATISGPESIIESKGTWAVEALSGLRPQVKA
jgi:hypothetical protein